MKFALRFGLLSFEIGLETDESEADYLDLASEAVPVGFYVEETDVDEEEDEDRV